MNEKQVQIPDELDDKAKELPVLQGGSFVDDFDELDFREISVEEETLRGIRP